MSDEITIPRELLEKITCGVSYNDLYECCGEHYSEDHDKDCWYVAIRKLLGDPRFCDAPEDPGIHVTVTAKQALDRGMSVWEPFCTITGLSDWCIAEGMDGSTRFELTEEQARRLGFIK